MILVDTNIIIDFWDKPTEKAKKIFAENDIAICGVVKAELLRGSNSDKQFCQMENALKYFFYLPLLCLFSFWDCIVLNHDNFNIPLKPPPLSSRAYIAARVLFIKY